MKVQCAPEGDDGSPTGDRGEGGGGGGGPGDGAGDDIDGHTARLEAAAPRLPGAVDALAMAYAYPPRLWFTDQGLSCNWPSQSQI